MEQNQNHGLHFESGELLHDPHACQRLVGN